MTMVKDYERKMKILELLEYARGEIASAYIIAVELDNVEMADSLHKVISALTEWVLTLRRERGEFEPPKKAD